VKSLHLFIVISAANHFVFSGARMVVLLDAIRLQASPAVVGILAALFGLVSAIGSVAVGRWMDRVGPAGAMKWCSVIMVAGAAVGFFWRDLAALFFVSTLIGSFYNFFYLGHTQWLGKMGNEEDRAKNVSLASLGFSSAAFLGPLATGFMIDGLGYAQAYLLLAAVPLFPFVVIALNTIEAPAGSGRRDADSPACERHGGVMELLRDRRLLRIYGMAVLAHTTWSLVNFLVPVYGAQIGLSASTIGVILGAYAIATVVIRAFLPLLARRFTIWQLMILSFAVTGVSFVIFPVVTGTLVLIVLAFCIGLGLGLSGPLAQALLYEASPPGRLGEVMGLRVSAMNLNQTVVPFLSGAAGAALGIAPVFWAMAALLFAGSYVTRGQWKRDVSQQDAA
jgi:predicted MFS family arabinose efflux permease